MSFDLGDYELRDMRVAVRLFAKAVAEGDCWRWVGAKARAGYGFVRIAGKNIYAHRAAYALMRAGIPAGLELDHLCRNPSCVNPWHLEPVTSRENTLRGESVQAKNARKTHCVRSHPLSGANLRIDPTGRRICRTCKRESNRTRRAAA